MKHLPQSRVVTTMRRGLVVVAAVMCACARLSPASALVNKGRQSLCTVLAPVPSDAHRRGGRWPDPSPLRTLFQRLPENLRKPAINGFAATCAGISAVLVATPIEAVKVGIQIGG